MSKEMLRKIWTVVGTMLALLAPYSWLGSQGGPLIGTGVFTEGRPYIAAYYSVYAISFLSIVISTTGIAYLKHSRNETRFLARLPLFGFEDVDNVEKSHWSYTGFQSFVLLFVVVIPLASLVHLNLKVVKHAIVWDHKMLEHPNDPSAIPSVDYACFLGLGRRCEDMPLFQGKLKFADKVEDLQRYRCFREEISCSHQENLNVTPGCATRSAVCRGEDFVPWITNTIPIALSLVAWSFVAALLIQAGRRGAKGKPAVKNTTSPAPNIGDGA